MAASSFTAPSSMSSSTTEINTDKFIYISYLTNQYSTSYIDTL